MYRISTPNEQSKQNWDVEFVEMYICNKSHENACSIYCICCIFQCLRRLFVCYFFRTFRFILRCLMKLCLFEYINCRENLKMICLQWRMWNCIIFIVKWVRTYVISLDNIKWMFQPQVNFKELRWSHKLSGIPLRSHILAIISDGREQKICHITAIQTIHKEF